jgi:hypothetical protein
LLSLENDAEYTGSVCPLSSFTCSPVLAFHTRTVLSPEALTINSPSLEGLERAANARGDARTNRVSGAVDKRSQVHAKAVSVCRVRRRERVKICERSLAKVCDLL